MAVIASTDVASASGLGETLENEELFEKEFVKENCQSINLDAPNSQICDLESSDDIVIRLRANLESLTDLTNRLSFMMRELRYLMK